MTLEWEMLAAAGRRSLIRGVVLAAAYWLANPLWAGVLVLTGLIVWTDVDLRWSAIAAVAASAGTRVLRGRVARRSRSDRQLNPLVKSLALRKRVRWSWRPAMRENRLFQTVKNGQDQVPAHRRIRLTPYGVKTEVNVGRISVTTAQLAAKSSNLEAKFGARQSRVRSLNPGWAQLELRHTDPLNRIITTADLPPATRPGYGVVGLDEDGQGVETRLRLPKLIVGAQGAGKSCEVWVTLYALVKANIPLRLYVFDPKGGQEFTELRDAAYRYERNPLKWPALLGQVLGAMHKRQEELARRNIRNLRTFTDRNPLVVLVIDELVTVAAFKTADVVFHTADGKQTLKAGAAHMLYLSQGRAAGYTELACTQLPQKNVIGPEVMDLIPSRTCLRVTSAEVVDMVLQRSGASKEYPAHLLPEDESSAGQGWLASEARGIVKYRAAMLSDAERGWVVEQVAEMKARQQALRFTDRGEPQEEAS